MATLLEDGREGDAAQNGESSELPADEAPVATAPADLPLANDYQGIGGPSSVPLYSPDAFERPDVTPHLNCILDDLFLAPSPQQLRAYQRVLSRQEMQDGVLMNVACCVWSDFFPFVIAAHLMLHCCQILTSCENTMATKKLLNLNNDFV